jgi:DNA repair protein RadC
MPNELTLREKALVAGPEMLSDSELVSLLTRIDAGLLKDTVEEVGLFELYGRRFDLGLAEPQRVRLEAVYLLTQRIGRAKYTPGMMVKSPDDIGWLMQDIMQFSEVEVAKLVLIDGRGKLLRIRDLALGSSNAAVITPREVAIHCIRAGCCACIIAHSHPSGVPDFSDSDIESTRRLAEGLVMVGIRLLDHLVVGAGEWKSAKRMGLLLEAER